MGPSSSANTPLLHSAAMSDASTAATAPRAPRHRLLWLALLACALVELAGHALIRLRVSDMTSWLDAAAFIEKEMRSGDAIAVAPSWADPVLRWVLGERIPMSMAGRSDLAAYSRLWAVSVRGYRPQEAPTRDAELDRMFGRVRVRRWKLPAPTARFDFVEHIDEAEVAIVQNGRTVSCPRKGLPLPRGGGLGKGPLAPRERFACDRKRPWLWVGATVMEDMDLQPRRCVHQHAAGREPVRVTFDDVPLAERIVLYGGIYYEHARHREHGPVHVDVFAEGERVGHMMHHDGEGWTRMDADTHALAGRRGRVRIEVRAPDPRFRTFCWAASVRDAARDTPR